MGRHILNTVCSLLQMGDYSTRRLLGDPNRIALVFLLFPNEVKRNWSSSIIETVSLANRYEGIRPQNLKDC